MNTTIPTKNTGDTLSAAEINNVAQAVNSKQDAATGFGLISSADQSKLNGLSNLFLGSYASLSALQAAHPTANAGQYGQVDVAGSAPIQYTWDATDNQYVGGAPGSGTVTSVNGQTGAVTVPVYTDIQAQAANASALAGKVDKVTGSRLITSAESTLLGNTSGVNTGDETAATIKFKLGISNLSGSNTGDQDLSGYATTGSLSALQTQVNGIVSVPAIKKKFGILIPIFKVANKFDNLGATLSASQLAIASGGGLISGTAGTVSDGYLKFQSEILPTNPTRTDWKILWDTTDTNAVKVGIGTGATGYIISIANVGGNMVITWPSGATTSGAISSGNLTGVLNLSVSISTANGVVTCSVSVLGVPTLANTNPFRVPVWESVINVKNGLYHAYFNSSSTLSKIVGFLHNSNDWSGDPFGQLLTQTVIVNGAGWPNEHDNIIVVPPRANISTTMRVVNYCHGRTLQAQSIFDITIADSGETGRQLLNAGYAVIGTSGGVYSSGQPATNECDYWGNPTGTQRAAQVYDALAANVYNVGNEYLIGWSMGGCSTTNYAKLFCNRVMAVDLCCPVLDMEENTTTPGAGVQNSAALKNGIDYSYAEWYIGKTNVAVVPYSDDGTNLRKIAGPGQYPERGARAQSYFTLATAGSSSGTIPQITLPTANLNIQSGDTLFFKLSGQVRECIGRPDGSTTFIQLNAQVTYPANEQVAVVRRDGRPSNSANWINRPGALNTGAAVAVGAYARALTPHPELDIRPHNPARFPDFYAEIGIPFHITTSGARNTNDGILNNEPMYAFADAVNSITPGLVTMIQGSGGHIAAGTLNAATTLAFFNAH